MPFRLGVDALWHPYFSVHLPSFFRGKIATNDLLHSPRRGHRAACLECDRILCNVIPYRRSRPIGPVPRRYDAPSRSVVLDIILRSIDQEGCWRWRWPICVPEIIDEAKWNGASIDS